MWLSIGLFLKCYSQLSFLLITNNPFYHIRAFPHNKPYKKQYTNLQKHSLARNHQRNILLPSLVSLNPVLWGADHFPLPIRKLQRGNEGAQFFAGLGSNCRHVDFIFSLLWIKQGADLLIAPCKQHHNADWIRVSPARCLFFSNFQISFSHCYVTWGSLKVNSVTNIENEWQSMS